jgi:hypothetical protein
MAFSASKPSADAEEDSAATRTTPPRTINPDAIVLLRCSMAN